MAVDPRASSSQTVLLTGVAGFIGSHTARALLTQGHRVVGVDNLNDYYDVRLKDHRLDRLLGGDGQRLGPSPKQSAFAGAKLDHGAFSFRALDVEDAAAVHHLFASQHFDAVINLAARAGVRYSVEHPEVYASTNVSGAVNLLQAMARHGVKKYVLASSSSLYAGAPTPFVETHDVNRPLSPYAASKLGAEAMSYAFHHLHGIDVSVLRYFTVYGPASRPDMSPLRFIKWIDEGTPITLYGDGSQTRDFTYVDDIVAGTIAALRPLGYDEARTREDGAPQERAPQHGEGIAGSGHPEGRAGYNVINLGGGNAPTAIRDMIAIIETALGKAASIRHEPFHSGDMMDTAADVSKAARLLDWHPTVKPADGFRRMVEWYEANRVWLRDIRL